MDNFDNFYKNFSNFLSELNHKNSYVKERILRILYQSDRHLSAHEIQTIFRKNFKENISLPAIYGVLNFLFECGLTNSYDEDSTRKYELNLGAHHDHLICEICHKVVAFSDEIIEARQDEICDKHGFSSISHNMILYGICDQCQQKIQKIQKK